MQETPLFYFLASTSHLKAGWVRKSSRTLAFFFLPKLELTIRNWGGALLGEVLLVDV